MYALQISNIDQWLTNNFYSRIQNDDLENIPTRVIRTFSAHKIGSRIRNLQKGIAVRDLDLSSHIALLYSAVRAVGAVWTNPGRQNLPSEWGSYASRINAVD